MNLEQAVCKSTVETLGKHKNMPLRFFPYFARVNSRSTNLDISISRAFLPHAERGVALSKDPMFHYFRDE